jgi:ParB-like chromosome segregation protein Spo0J
VTVPAGGIIAGHGRVLAAKRLGIDAVPCMVAKGWSDAQKRALSYRFPV